MKIILIQLDDSLTATAETLIRRLQALELEPDPETVPAADEGPPVTPLARAEALLQRCRRVGAAVQKKHIVALTGLDEGAYYRWQRGAQVSGKKRRQFEEVVALSADEFLRRLVENDAGSELKKILKVPS